MSLLAPLHVTRRRRSGPAGGTAVTAQEWHVGLSHVGMFPQHEVGCPCAKAPCGLAIPRPDVLCNTHQGRVEYLQAHAASDCAPHKWFRRFKS
jgi:hypothetical protein